jgi:hypothetical protein
MHLHTCDSCGRFERGLCCSWFRLGFSGHWSRYGQCGCHSCSLTERGCYLLCREFKFRARLCRSRCGCESSHLFTVCFNLSGRRRCCSSWTYVRTSGFSLTSIETMGFADSSSGLAVGREKKLHFDLRKCYTENQLFYRVCSHCNSFVSFICRHYIEILAKPFMLYE